MLRTFSAAALLLIAGTAFAQSTPPGSPTPSVTPSPTPADMSSQTPVITPSAPATSTTVPSLPASPPTPQSNPAAVGGLSKCENLLGNERDRCQQQERAGLGGATGSTAPRQ